MVSSTVKLEWYTNVFYIFNFTNSVNASQFTWDKLEFKSAMPVGSCTA